jgi:hypothetical protein
VRIALAFILTAIGLVTALAQEQERRLIDRVLKPDMTLENRAQNKKFTGKPKVIERQASVRTFYISQTPQTKTKEFAEQREYSAREFAAHHFRDGQMKSTMQARAARVKTFTVEGGTGALVVRDVSDAEKKIASSDFAGSRPFLGKGKSQKPLTRHNRPLSIDEVRELLNKNK